MDPAQEQALELEALQAIFADDLQIYVGTLPTGWADRAVGETFKITILPHEEGEEAVEGAQDSELQMELLWAHTAQYPEEAPLLKLRPVYGLSDAEVGQCRDHRPDRRLRLSPLSCKSGGLVWSGLARQLESVCGCPLMQVAAANKILGEQVEENLGMAMIYTLVTAAKEWLRGGWQAYKP